MRRGRAGICQHPPAPPAEQRGRTRQPWPLFQGAITCCLATTRNSWLFVYSISCAKLKAQTPNHRIQHHQSCNRRIRKRIFLYLLQDFPALPCCSRKTDTQSPTHFDARPIWKIFQCVNSYFHNNCPLGSISTNKGIHIPTVTKTDSGPNTKGHVHSGMSVLDSMTKLCLQESCPCGLEVLIFPNYYLL